eukprot:scaffold7909_cov36-Tisochrysis_lutea.AAC.5
MAATWVPHITQSPCTPSQQQMQIIESCFVSRWRPPTLDYPGRSGAGEGTCMSWLNHPHYSSSLLSASMRHGMRATSNADRAASRSLSSTRVTFVAKVDKLSRGTRSLYGANIDDTTPVSSKPILRPVSFIARHGAGEPSTAPGGKSCTHVWGRAAARWVRQADGSMLSASGYTEWV